MIIWSSLGVLDNSSKSSKIRKDLLREEMLVLGLRISRKMNGDFT